MDLGFWRSRRVLVTGHTGFKGAWLALWLERLGARLSAIALAPATRPNLYDLLAPWNGLEDVRADLRDGERTIALIGDGDAEILFHLAAQSLVPEAQRDPAGTFATNVMGTVHVLEAALRARSLRALLVVTTDKVYQNSGRGDAFREDDRLGGDEPYSASKAACEMAVAAYREPFSGRGKALATVRAGNVIGGGDWAADRIVPDLLRSLETRQPTAIRNPAGVRPWQHVLDPLAGYLAFAERLAARGGDLPAALNFGPEAASDRPVEELIRRFVAHFADHPGWRAAPASVREAAMLRLDSSRAQAMLNWRPRLAFEAAVDWTAEWHARHRAGADMRAFSLEQIARYEALP
jgi:CDP-glucose 4,6-dehydratase